MTTCTMTSCTLPLANGSTYPVRSISTPGFERCPSTLPLSSSFQEDDADQEGLDMVEALKKLAVSIEKTNCLLRKHTESLTFLRQTLFRAYSKSISSPTDRNIERKVPVEVRCSFLKIVDVNTVKQNFEAEVFVEAKWPEPALMGVAEKELRHVDYTQYWNPKLMVLNVEGTPSSERSSYTAKPPPDPGAVPMMVMRRRIKGIFRENLELEHFPFDVQELTIQVSTDRSVEEMELIEDREALSTINTETFLDSQEWAIHEHVETTRSETTVEDASATTRPILHVQCRVARKVGYFFWNIIFVMFLISILSFSAFSIGATVPNRLQTTITLLLTAVAFKMVAKQHLPMISYLTYLDIYVIASLVFLSLQAVQNAVASASVKALGQDQALVIDNVSVTVLLGAIVLFHILFGIYIYRTAFRRRRLMSKKDREYKIRKTELEKRKNANHALIVNATDPKEAPDANAPFL